MSILGKFLGSNYLARTLKLFIQNPENNFTSLEIREKTKGREDFIAPILKRLVSIKFLGAKNIKSQKRYFLNTRFVYLPEVKKLVLKEVPMLDNSIVHSIKKIKHIQFASVGGVLVGDKKGSVDLLVVSNVFNRSRFKRIIQNIEAEIGQEVNFTLMDEKEFSYRYDLYDKFIIVMMEEPNIIVVNKMKLDDRDDFRKRDE